MLDYRILIADDQSSANKNIYDRLLDQEGSATFDRTVADGPSDFRERVKHGYDVILLDVNLDDWGITLKDALGCIGSQSPVVLVSQLWAEPMTHHRVVDAMAAAKKVRIAGTLGLNQLNDEGWESYVGEMQSQLRLAIAAHRRQGLLELGESDEIRILHLSDPQYGDPQQDHWAFLAENEIAEFVGDELQERIHFVAITGDITYSGQPGQFNHAEEKLSIIANEFLPAKDDWREPAILNVARGWDFAAAATGSVGSS